MDMDVDKEWKPVEMLGEVATGDAPDPSCAYARLLAQSTVAWYDHGIAGRTWGIFGRDAVARLAMDTATLSNVIVPPGTPRILPLMADPPEHGGYRRLLNSFFSPSAIKAAEAEARPIAIEMIDRMIDAGQADFGSDYAYVFSMRVLCRFLRVKDDWQIYNDWSSEMERLTGAGTAQPGDALPAEHMGKVIPYIQQLVADRRADPGEDVVSGIILGEVEGEALRDDQIVGLIIALILAGRSTTASGIGNLVLRLAKDPQLQQFLRENPSRIKDAVEESLRLESPQQEMPRKARRDFEVDGHQIKAGESVFLNWGSANVDPASWDRPSEFDIDRKTWPHLAFGRGPHQCFGAPLGRMEMRVTVEELLARTRSFSLAGEVTRNVWPRLSVETLPLRLVASG